jgi:uncharacterized membrane protein
MAAGGDPGSIRASDSDRSRVQAVLNDAFAEGRITREEWEERATTLGGPVTHAELARLTSDLVPQPQPMPPPPAPYFPAPAYPSTNGMAIASLACGIGQLVGGPIAGVAAIILGHQARRQIRLTGEQGDGMAVTGLVLGYIGTVLAVLALVALVVGVAVVQGGGASVVPRGG